MKLPRLFLILQVTDELKRMNHQDESRWPRQAATGAWSSRKCEYLSPVLYKRYQIWVISAVYWWSLFEQPDEWWAGLCDKTQRERVGRRAGCWGRRSRWPSSWTTVSWTESWFPVKFVDRHFLMHLLQVFVNYGFTCSETRTLYFYSSQLLSSFYRGATGSALTGNMTEKTKRNRGNCRHTIRLQSSFFLQMHIKMCHTFVDDNNQSESLLHRLICSVLPHFTCSRTKEPRKDYMEM